ncbi:MAG: hypothetical protein U9Q20_02885 [Campylobacterota bacterium]|nr:hypothetical protein [Campylobacterota bacterium]
MTENSFILSLTILLIIFFMRNKITSAINENFNFKYKIQSEWIVYILTIFFIAVISAGMLLDDTKNKYSDISNSFENIRTQINEKPKSIFDFDIGNFFNF